eukprot:365823-Chlamydomonas_euryale.AAC.15
MVTTAGDDDEARAAVWEAQSVLMLWLSMLILVPFDLATIDSSATDVLAARCDAMRSCKEGVQLQGRCAAAGKVPGCAAADTQQPGASAQVGARLA